VVRYFRLLIIFLLFNCDDGNIVYNERLQIYVNGELTEEFIYSNSGLLLQETTFSLQNDCLWQPCNDAGMIVGEVFKYYYRPDDQIDYIDVYGLDQIYLRQERHQYNDQNELSAIDFEITQDGNWKHHFDYDCNQRIVKSGDVFQIAKAENCGRTECWSMEIIPNYDLHNSNVTYISLPYAFAYVFIEYDDQKNPAHFTHSSRILPMRMSANNPVKIIVKYLDVHSGQVVTHHTVSIQYQYDNAGRPLSATRATSGYKCQTDSLEYIYDRVKK
jgi:hypothetical protein